MNKSCKNCQIPFEITSSDQNFYNKINVPEPTFCPNCREQRRLAFRSERYLYSRKCDMCKKNILSFFDNNVSFPVYCTDCFWCDKWDPKEYGQNYDFNRSFFEQFKELMQRVPKMGFLQLHNENSNYNTLLAYSKNTYMSPGSYYMEDSYYARKSQYSKDCMNSNFLDHCELVNLSTNCNNCYNCHNMINCRNCTDSGYLADSFGCKNCFMCSGISNKQYCYKNNSYTKEEYEKIVYSELSKDQKILQQEFKSFNLTIPKKNQNLLNCENCSGDYLHSCKNANYCYDCFNVEDSKYVIESVAVKDSMDLSLHDKDIELCYELCSGGESNYNLKFSFCSCACPNSDYLYSCFYLSDSFGCDGFHARQKNCILNKQYSEEEYKILKSKIIDHMKKTQEYGEFFPIQLSLYSYNETLAQDYFPLNKEQAQVQNYQWREKNQAEYRPSTTLLTNAINNIPDSITNELLACEDCSKNYRIITQELKLCRKMKQPLSKKCPDCRYQYLLNLKNPRKLFDRICNKCQKSIQSTYSPERSETVYCEECYLKEIL